MDRLSEILYRWELIYDVLKNKWKDGRHFADPEHMRTGFIALYEHITQLEAENKAWRAIGDELEKAREERAIARTRTVYEMLDALKVGGDVCGVRT